MVRAAATQVLAAFGYRVLLPAEPLRECLCNVLKLGTVFRSSFKLLTGIKTSLVSYSLGLQQKHGVSGGTVPAAFVKQRAIRSIADQGPSEFLPRFSNFEPGDPN